MVAVIFDKPILFLTERLSSFYLACTPLCIHKIIEQQETNIYIYIYIYTHAHTGCNGENYHLNAKMKITLTSHFIRYIYQNCMKISVNIIDNFIQKNCYWLQPQLPVDFGISCKPFQQSFSLNG